MTTPEFARPVRLDTLGAAERTIEVRAEQAEREALARRFGLISVDRLEGRFQIRADSLGARAEGEVVAEVVQACIATGEPLTARVEEQVELHFVPEASLGGGEEEAELDADDCDTVTFSGGAIDLGEAAAETMALALDPFPRSPGAERALREAGVIGEGEAGPFGALAALRDTLKS